MKQLIDLKSIWFNTKRALYATMVLTLAVSIPALSWVELSHKEDAPEKTTRPSHRRWNARRKVYNSIIRDKFGRPLGRKKDCSSGD